MFWSGYTIVLINKNISKIVNDWFFTTFYPKYYYDYSDDGNTRMIYEYFNIDKDKKIVYYKYKESVNIGNK